MTDEETKQVEVMLGPYAGQILGMPAADADAAIAAKWAIAPRTPPIDANAAPLPDLSPEERQVAEEAAGVWAAEQRGESEPKSDKPDEDEDEDPDPAKPRGARRTVAPSRPGGYETRRR